MTKLISTYREFCESSQNDSTRYSYFEIVTSVSTHNIANFLWEKFLYIKYIYNPNQTIQYDPFIYPLDCT
jgi:hypothetical protein